MPESQIIVPEGSSPVRLSSSPKALAQDNPPVTAAAVAAAIVGLLAAFTSLSADQLAAIGAALSIVLAVVAQRWTWPASKAELVPVADIDVSVDDGEPHGDPTIGEPDLNDFPA